MTDYASGKATSKLSDLVLSKITTPDEGINRSLGDLYTSLPEAKSSEVPKALFEVSPADILSILAGDVVGRKAGKYSENKVAESLIKDKGKLQELRNLTGELEPYIDRGHENSIRNLAGILRLGGVPGTTAISDIVPSWTKQSAESMNFNIKPFKMKNLNQGLLSSHGTVSDKIKKLSPQASNQVSSVTKLQSAPKLPRNVKAQM